MSKYYYQKEKRRDIKKIFRFLGLGIFIAGFLLIIYVFFPLLSWQIYFAPVFASNNIASPIPKTTIVSPGSLQSLIADAKNNLTGVDYTDAQNWFPTYKTKSTKTKQASYTLSIPSLNIKDALVSTIDNDLSSHLVNYGGTAVPPDNGNAVVFGHSTLPQLFNPKDYKTIFATLYKLKVGDEFLVGVEGISYSYKIESITIVEPEDTSIFTQDLSNSFVTLVTCTPPGTTWKRLIIKARFKKI